MNASQMILANNVATISNADGLGFLYGDHNLVEDSTGVFLVGGNHITGQDPILGPLQDNGGPTFTHALLVGSPAIDAGDNSLAPATDQRGFSRPQDGGQRRECGRGHRGV